MLEQSYSELTLDELRQIDEVAERFEADCSAAKSPAIEAYLNCVPERLRPHLERELLEIDEVARSGRVGIAEDSTRIASDSGDDHSSVGRDALKGILQDSDREDSIGRISAFEVLSIIGSGGMGVVAEAWDTRLSRRVALKVPIPRIVSDSRIRRRFLHEARSAGSVRHPNVVGIYSIEDEDGTPLLVLEYVDGPSLADISNDAIPMPLSRVVEIGRDVASGLVAAHTAGIVHRDLKPGNVLVESTTGRARISDFGLARAIDSPELTGTGELVGTPRYMSPEQVEGQPVDHRSDLFSLGAVLYRLLTGRHAFTGTKPITLARQICDSVPVPPKQLRPDAPDWLCDLIEHLLEKDPERRPQTTVEVYEILVESPLRPRRFCSFRYGALSLLGGAVLVGMIALWVWPTSPVDPDPARAEPITSEPEATEAVNWIAKLGSPTAQWSESYRAIARDEPAVKEVCPTLTGDGNTLYFAVEKSSDGRNGIHIATRESAHQPWSVEPRLSLGIDSEYDVNEPGISADGRTLVFSAFRIEDGVRGYDLWTSRKSLDGTWQTTQPIKVLNSDTYESRPILSQDGLMLIFTSFREPTVGARDMWISIRDEPDGKWGEPVRLSEKLNTVDHELPNQLLGPEPVLLFSRADPEGLRPRTFWLSRRNAQREWEEPVMMSTPFDDRIEAMCVFDEGDSIVYQTARDGWDKSQLRIVHRQAD